MRGAKRNWGPQAIVLFISIVFGSVAAVIAYKQMHEAELSAYIFLMAVIFLGMWLFDVVIERRHKLAKFLFGAVPLAWALGILVIAHQASHSWTVSAPLSLAGILFGVFHLAAVNPKSIRGLRQEEGARGPRSVFD